jgi:hypothetical protein
MNFSRGRVARGDEFLAGMNFSQRRKDAEAVFRAVETQCIASLPRTPARETKNRAQRAPARNNVSASPRLCAKQNPRAQRARA